MIKKTIFKCVFLIFILYSFQTKAQDKLFEILESPIVLKGNDTIAYRDPAILYHNNEFHLFFTIVRTEESINVYSYTAHSTSKNLSNWSKPKIITPKGQNLNYSSPGNVIRFKDEWILCLQSYPRPNYQRGDPLIWANTSARIFVMRSNDLENWSEAELLKVKGPRVPISEMGRMIDPYLLEDKDKPGKFWCFYKQNGVSYSYTFDFVNWTFVGSTQSGENVSVLVENDEYILFHSPKNGIGIKRSYDFINWKDDEELITLGQKNWPWAENRLTAGTVIDLRNEPSIKKYVMFFHAGGPGEIKTQDNVNANCSIGIAWSDDIKNWDWPGKDKRPNDTNNK
jgi:hypothetical protein